MKKFVKIFSFILVVSLLAACGSSEEKVNVSGGTAVVPIIEAGYEEFAKSNEGVVFNINSDGSSAGIKAANEGVSQIGLSGRDLKEEEKEFGLTETVFARDALAVIVHPSNGVDDLTTDQLHDIFGGKVTNWKEVGGKDLAITIVSREDGSGSRSVFEEKTDLLDEEENSLLATEKAVIANSTGAVVENVESKEGAIGYVSIGELDNDKIKDVSVNGVKATQENVLADKYAIARPFIMITKDESDVVNSFLEFMMSEEGQQIVKDNGLVSVK